MNPVTESLAHRQMRNNVPTYPVQTIAKLLLISERRVQQLTKEGVLPKSNRGKYELAPTIQGYVRYLQERVAGNAAQSTNIEYHKEKARKTKAEADIAEMEAARMAGELVPVEEVKMTWSNLASEVCTRLRNVPTRVVSSVIGETDENRLKSVLLNEIDSALTAIADGNSRGSRKPAKNNK